MTSQELKISANYITKLASYADAEDRISLYLDSLFANQQIQKDSFSIQNNEIRTFSNTIYKNKFKINYRPKCETNKKAPIRKQEQYTH